MARAKKTEVVPYAQRKLLTVNEASAYFGLGINRIERILKENGRFVVRVGGCGRKMVRRELLETYIDGNEAI